jgi:MSHA pilin protein MshD
MSTERSPPLQRGFTLIELIIFIVVVSVGVVGILSVLNITAQHSSDPVYPKQALAIAEALMEEIQAKDFTAPTTGNFTPSAPPTALERQNFDNVLDFNTYGTGLAGIFNISGNPVAGLANYNVLVNVAAAGAALNTIPAVDMWVITITVTDPGGSTNVFTGYRINYD